MVAQSRVVACDFMICSILKEKVHNLNLIAHASADEGCSTVWTAAIQIFFIHGLLEFGDKAELAHSEQIYLLHFKQLLIRNINKHKITL